MPPAKSLNPPTLRPPRPKYRAARAFYLTLFLLTCVALFALLARPFGESLPVRSLEKRGDDDESCREVHRAHDQCAFVRAHCPDDEGGFTAYLDLYYCKLPHVKPVAFLVLISWLGLLFSTIGIAASDFFCIDLSTIAAILGMSESLTGVTFLALGNGSPDVFSTFAAMSTNSGSLALGELFGAAGFITAVVAGSMALIRPFHVARKSFVRDVGFFIVAAGFSMIFIWDGRLHLWECIAMVAYYIFYVIFVVAWHWWIARRRQRREKEAAARGHFIPPEEELAAEHQPYRDDPEDDNPSQRPTPARSLSLEDWSALERGGDDGEDEDEEEEARDKWMSELASNMRLTGVGRARANTATPVRPSLVGALEFQAVLKSLQRSRNIQTIPMHARRYSDDPYYTTAQQQDQMSTTSDPSSRPPYEVTANENGSPSMERATLSVPLSAPAGRSRAVSANGAVDLRIDSDLRRSSRANWEEVLIDVASESKDTSKSQSKLGVPPAKDEANLKSPTVRIEPATPRLDAPISSPHPEPAQSPNRLAPPGQSSPAWRHLPDRNEPHAPNRHDTDDSNKSSPRSVPRASRLPKIVIPTENRSRSSSRATSPFPRYKDSPSPTVSASSRSPVSTRPPSLYLPSPLGPISSPEEMPELQNVEVDPPRPTKWWPYSFMPPPGVIVAALFPTIYHWHDKTWWEKCLGLIAAPSVFLLTITLPVVESDADEDDAPVMSPTRTDTADASRTNGRSLPNGVDKAIPSNGMEDGRAPGPPRLNVTTPDDDTGVAIGSQQYRGVDPSLPTVAKPIAELSNDVATTRYPEPATRTELWNRWLTIIQLYFAPVVIVLSVYLQNPADVSPAWLLRPMLISLLVSTVLLIPLLLTTTPQHRPPFYRIILSLVGFTVAIAWISAIAAQVVGALKALAVILNMSHAIMGLTIFAVGNSLGDLVADVTVARLGYPVMALSACFGGPMLNILLGVGLSGSYQLIWKAEQRKHKHPNDGLHFKTYHIEVSRTLIISGFTLLVTLFAVLVFVPLNKWVFSRRIGLTLMALWLLSTIGNVVVEVTGWGEKSAH